jgi:hypothetical protein
MLRMARILLIALCFAALASAGTARADEAIHNAALQKKLRSAYDAFKSDASLRELEKRANANHRDRAAVDALLKRMPLSPLEYLQVDMEVRHYEVAVPRFLQELHVRWIELNEPLARSIYGDEHIDQVLTRWPADTGSDIIGTEAMAVTVGTNRNAASTDIPAPVDYDGEIQIAVNHRNTNQMVAAANSWGNAGTPCNNQDTQTIFYSSNGGTTWDYTCAPSNNVFSLGTCSGTIFGSDPALAWNDNNEVFLNYMLLCNTSTSTKYSMVVARSADGGATWVNQGVIKNAWATGTLEDKNFYAIDNNLASPYYGRHYTCWDRANNEKSAYSSNNGSTWTEVDLPAVGVGGVDLGCEIAVQKNGTVHVIFDSLTCGTSTCTDERMWYTKSTNGGVSWSTPVQVHDNNLAGFSGANKPPVADNRGINPFGAVDVDNSGGACDGTLYAVFSDWTSGGATETDVWLTRSTNGGTTWGTPVKINDDGLAARTQFHPFVQVDQSTGNVVVAWHDARNDSANRKVDFYTARSTNCGLSFEANVKASQPSAEFNNSGISYTDENTTDNANRNPNQYGEYMGLDVKNGKAYLAWVDSRHFYPGSSTNNQKENVGFAVVDFGVVPPCVNFVNQVPVMTSDIAPSGTVTTSGVYSASYPAWQAFDASNSTMWISELNETPAWIAYEWSSARTVYRYSLVYTNGSITSRAPKDFELQGWNGSTWVTVDSRSAQTGWSGNETRSFVVSSPGAYTKYRLNITDDNDSTAGVVVVSLGRLILDGCSCVTSTSQVPAMTSDTTPSGTVSTSGVYSVSYPAWQAFDSSSTSMWISEVNETPAWLAYSWGSGRYIETYALSYVNGSITSRAPKDWVLEGWNGSAWVTVDTRTSQVGWTGNETRTFTVATPGTYTQYRLNIADDNDSTAGVVVISLGGVTLNGCSN